MFGDQPITFTVISNGSITKGHVVSVSGTSGRSQLGVVATSAASGAYLGGIALADTLSGDNLGVAAIGLVRAVAGGAVAIGVRVTTNSIGRVTAAASGDHVVGISREAALANGDTFEVLVAAIGERVLA